MPEMLIGPFYIEIGDSAARKGLSALMRFWVDSHYLDVSIFKMLISLS